MSMLHRIKALALAVPFAGLMLLPGSAQAHVDFFVGLGGYPPPVYYAPPPPPVYYGPPPVYYGPPPGYYRPAPPVYYVPGWRHHHHWRRDYID
jgi:hypothetical protein